MPIHNYHEIELQLGGRKIIVGGFCKPENSNECKDLKESHGIEAVINLRGDGSSFDERFAQKFHEGGFNLAFYTDDPSVQVYDWYDDFINPPKPNNPLIYDAIYHTVIKTNEAGKKIALFCGTGDGRTGAALACMKLRELLEKEHALNKENFNTEQARTQNIYVQAILPGNRKGGEVKVTPLVKQAIESVRSIDNPGHHSLELANDVESVLLYENHLRKELSQRLERLDALYPPTPPQENSAPIQRLGAINSAYDFWVLLHRFPPYQYEDIIENVDIEVFRNPLVDLSNEIANYRLPPDHKLAFDDAVLLNVKKLGGPYNLIKYALNSRSFDLVPRVLGPISKEKLFELGDFLCEWKGLHPESLIYILNLLDVKDRPAFLQKQNKDGTTLLGRMIKWRPVTLPTILGLLNEEDQIPLLMTKDAHHRTLLFTSVESAEGLQTILKFYPENVRVSILNEKNSEGETLLSRELNKNYRTEPALLSSILSFYPAEERFSALKASLHDYPLHQLARNESSCLLPVLNLLLPHDLLTALKQPNQNGMTIMGLLPHQASNTMLKFLRLYSPVERMNALSEPNSYGGRVFDTLDKNKENLVVLESLISKHGVSTLLQESLSMKQGEGPTKTLREYAGGLEKLVNLLEYYPPEERLKALSISVKEACPYMTSWFYIATQNPNVLLEILNLLPTKDRSAPMMVQNYSGDTVLDAIGKKDPHMAQKIQEIILVPPEAHPTKRIKVALQQQKSNQNEPGNDGSLSSKSNK